MARGDFKGKLSNKGQGFDANPQNINKKGRPKPFYAALMESIGGGEGEILFPAESCRTITREGKEYIVVTVPSEQALMLKLWRHAHGKNDKLSLDALKYIADQAFGKAKQVVEDISEGGNLLVMIGNKTISSD